MKFESLTTVSYPIYFFFLLFFSSFFVRMFVYRANVPTNVDDKYRNRMKSKIKELMSWRSNAFNVLFLSSNLWLKTCCSYYTPQHVLHFSAKFISMTNHTLKLQILKKVSKKQNSIPRRWFVECNLQFAKSICAVCICSSNAYSRYWYKI